MAIYNKQIKFTREQLLDHYLIRNSITDLIYSIIRVLIIVIQNLYCISSYLVLTWLILLPISWFRNDLYSRLENHLYNSLVFVVSSWSLAAGVTIVEAGDEYKHLIEEPGGELEDIGNFEKLKLKQQQQQQKSLDDYENSKQYITDDSNDDISNYNHNHSNSKRYLDNLLDSYRNRKNGYHRATQTGNRLENDSSEQQISYYARSKVESMGNKIAYRLNGFTNGVIETINNFNRDHHNQSGDRPKNNNGIIVAVNGTEKESVNIINHNNNNNNNISNKNKNNNNNIISENNHITAKTNGHRDRMKSLKPNPRELTSLASLRNDSAPANLSTLKNIQDKPRVLFLCNHISTADVPLIMQSFSTLTNQSILWVLDAQFKLTNFGVCCGSHGDFFVAKSSFVDGSLREHVLKYDDRNLLVLFPEGGFLRKRIEGSNRYATKNGFPLTKYVTHPRFGAFKDLIDPSVGVTHIVDATLMYDDIKNPLSIFDIILGNRKQPAILNYKLYKRSEINPTEEWLREIWLEKDKLLAKYYEDRECVLKQIDNTLRVALLDWFKTLSVHLFYLLVCYLAIFRLFNATSVTMLKARELYYSNI